MNGEKGGLRVSYSASIAYLLVDSSLDIQILLVLKRAERIPQISGEYYEAKRRWTFPGGTFDPSLDRDICDTAVREGREEARLNLVREDLSLEGSCSRKFRSQRPGFDFHNETIFIVVRPESPPHLGEGIDEEEIETVRFFPLSRLPQGTGPESLGAPMSPTQCRSLADFFHRKAELLREKFGFDFVGLAIDVQRSCVGGIPH